MGLFYPSIDQATGPLVAMDLSAYTWLDTIITSTRLIIFLICLFLSLLATFASWWSRR